MAQSLSPRMQDLKRRPFFVMSMDTDWCSEATLAYVLREVVDPRLPLTLFATDAYSEAANRVGTELALHYNVDNASFTDAFAKIAEVLPAARGARGHSLAVSERLRASWSGHRIAYDSSFMMYLQQEIVPFPIARGVLELPIYFMDMFAMEYEQGDLAQFPNAAQMCGPGLKVLDFHPVHLVLNTPSFEYYFAHKKWYHDHDQLLRHQYRGYGVRSYFEDVQRWIFEGDHPRTTCLGIAEIFGSEFPACSLEAA